MREIPHLKEKIKAGFTAAFAIFAVWAWHSITSPGLPVPPETVKLVHARFDLDDLGLLHGTFTISNSGTNSVKDFHIFVNEFAPSGTRIESQPISIYQVVGPAQTSELSYAPIPVAPQVTRFSAFLAGFSDE